MSHPQAGNLCTVRYSAFGKSLCTHKRCWKWCPWASIQAWTRLILFANTCCRSAFGKLLCTHKSCWKWCPQASIQAWNWTYHGLRAQRLSERTVECQCNLAKYFKVWDEDTETFAVLCLVYHSSLNILTVGCSETLTNICETACYHTPEDCNIRSHFRENLSSHELQFILWLMFVVSHVQFCLWHGFIIAYSFL
jgi:hypothetical protein